MADEPAGKAMAKGTILGAAGFVALLVASAPAHACMDRQFFHFGPGDGWIVKAGFPEYTRLDLSGWCEGPVTVTLRDGEDRVREQFPATLIVTPGSRVDRVCPSFAPTNQLFEIKNLALNVVLEGQVHNAPWILTTTAQGDVHGWPAFFYNVNS